jgi:2-keto-3-deoxy-L-rhamnonate aldolase RhmA
VSSNSLKKRLEDGKVACGGWIAFSDLFSLEVMALAGFDWLLFDLEHCPIGLADLRAMIPIVSSTDTSAIVRVPDNGDYWIKQSLDLGANGVMVPRVDSAAAADRAVRATKYYPIGERGFGPVRASRYGDDKEYSSGANEGTLLFVQLEHQDAIDNLDEIMNVRGIDGFFFGRADLSQSMGLLGQPDAPEVVAVIHQTAEKLNRANRPWGTPASTEGAFREFVKVGGQLMTLGGDLMFLKRNAEEYLARMRAVSEEGA